MSPTPVTLNCTSIGPGAPIAVFVLDAHGDKTKVVAITALIELPIRRKRITPRGSACGSYHILRNLGAVMK